MKKETKVQDITADTATTTNYEHSLDLGGLNPTFLAAQPRAGNQWRAGVDKANKSRADKNE